MDLKKDPESQETISLILFFSLLSMLHIQIVQHLGEEGGLHNVRVLDPQEKALSSVLEFLRHIGHELTQEDIYPSTAPCTLPQIHQTPSSLPHNDLYHLSTEHLHQSSISALIKSTIRAHTSHSISHLPECLPLVIQLRFLTCSLRLNFFISLLAILSVWHHLSRIHKIHYHQ